MKQNMDVSFSDFYIFISVLTLQNQIHCFKCVTKTSFYDKASGTVNTPNFAVGSNPNYKV